MSALCPSVACNKFLCWWKDHTADHFDAAVSLTTFVGVIACNRLTLAIAARCHQMGRNAEFFDPPAVSVPGNQELGVRVLVDERSCFTEDVSICGAYPGSVEIELDLDGEFQNCNLEQY